MALKKNVFTTDLQEFHNRLASFRHYRSFVSWQLGQAKNGIQSSLDMLERRGAKNQYGAGTGMSLFNIFHDGQYPIRALFGTEGEKIVPMADEMERRFNSYILVSVFEILEAFLKAAYGNMLYQLRNEITITDKKAFHQANPGWAKNEGTQPYYVRYAQHSCRRDCDQARAAFAKHLEWDQVIRICDIGLDFDGTVKAIGHCRHCIVHNEGRVTNDGLSGLSKPERAFVTSCLHKSQHAEVDLLLPPSHLLDQVFEALASYGWGLYVLLSKRLNMDDETIFFRPASGGKRKVKPL